MIPKECKRLTEADFPLSEVNYACVCENNRKTRVDRCQGTSGFPQLRDTHFPAPDQGVSVAPAG